MTVSNSTTNPDLIKCSCGVPLAKKVDDKKFELLKYYEGKTITISLKYSGNECDIICGNCGKKISFLTRKLELPMMYVVKAKEK